MALPNNPMTPSSTLAAVIGAAKVTRPQAIKKVWEYIKKNGLQSGRNINLDAKLGAVIGKSGTITMFELAGPVSKNLK